MLRIRHNDLIMQPLCNGHGHDSLADDSKKRKRRDLLHNKRSLRYPKKSSYRFSRGLHSETLHKHTDLFMSVDVEQTSTLIFAIERVPAAVESIVYCSLRLRSVNATAERLLPSMSSSVWSRQAR
uniref:Uncharacterized protein n=1 Tax=Glossina palpalis gambiensis TaxID=67801 RepID=A0A1B0B3J5_9MUSC